MGVVSRVEAVMGMGVADAVAEGVVVAQIRAADNAVGLLAVWGNTLAPMLDDDGFWTSLSV